MAIGIAIGAAIIIGAAITATAVPIIEDFAEGLADPGRTPAQRQDPFTGFDDPVLGPGDTTTAGGTPGVEGNTPGGTGIQTIPNKGDIAIAQAGIQNLQTKQFQMSGANSILGMKSQERQGVGLMRSRAAARNVDIKNSPLYNISTKEAESKQAIGLASESLAQSVDIQGRVRDLGWNSFLLEGAQVMKAAAQERADQWMNIFTDVMKIGIDFATGFPVSVFSKTATKPTTGGGATPWLN